MIVAIESASTDVSLAIADDSGTVLASDAWSAGHRHADELLPRLIKLASHLHQDLDQTALVAVGVGPGSFTGLRVGMSVAKGIALATGCRIIGLPSLGAWLASEADAAAAIGRAGSQEAYLQLRGEREAAVVGYDDLPAGVREAPVVAPTDLAMLLSLTRARPPFGAAAALAVQAPRAASAGSGDDLETLEPRYLRAPRGTERAVEGARWP